MVAFTDSAEDAFGKVMSWPDTLMPLAYELCTDQEMGGEGMEAKFKLAELIVGSYWGEKAAENARANWTATFSKGETPENILEIKADEQNFLSDTLIGQGIIASKNEWRRLVNDGAVSMDGEKITNLLAQAKSGTYRIGKHRFLKISTNT